MLEAKAIPKLRKAITRLSPLKRKKNELTTEHPDLKMIRRHKAAQAAVKNLEQIKDRGLIDNRSSFIR
ncbi:MAG: hypothetical protein ACXABY_12185 [Candidatus Thorarchaeota archaeon]|jgi:hypothetical protein